MKIQELLNELEIIDVRNPIGYERVTGIANHTKDLEKGNIFVAIKGYITDGHKYIEEAISKGAIAVLVEEFDDDFEIAQYKVSNTREALSIISDKFYNHPSKDLRVIGVTATNGKTTTTYMLNDIMEMAGFKTGLIGSVVNKIGTEFIPAVLTTPESLDLQKLLFKMKEENVEKVLMEVSSSALELSRVNNVDFDIVSFNNFSREHIDQHGTFEKYWEVKSSLIRNAKSESYAILNLDDEYSSSLIDKTKAQVITYSLKERAGNLYCKDLLIAKGRATFTVVINQAYEAFGRRIEKNEFKIILGVPGYHSVANAMAAIAIAITDGISIEVIKEALLYFNGVERRFQYIYENGFIIIDDHFANKGNINVTLETLRHMEYNNLHLVYAIRGNRGVTVNRENAEAVVDWKDILNIDEIIVTKSSEVVTSKDLVSDKEEAVFDEVMNKTDIIIHRYDRLDDAIKYALDQVEENDIILLAGCQGMDHGGKVALDYLHLLKPEIPKEELYKPILNRVVE